MAAPARAPWILTAVSILLLLVVLIWPALVGKRADSADDGRVPINQMEGVPSVGGSDARVESGRPNPGQLTGTPREQADRLFNRIMTAKENGDTANVKFFLPMGIQAYEMVTDIDADGLYHLSLLQDFGGDFASARETAEKILQTDPTHLLGLSAAATAALHAGDKRAAQRYAQRFLSSFDDEIKKSKSGYHDHENIFAQLKREMTAMR